MKNLLSPRRVLCFAFFILCLPLGIARTIEFDSREATGADVTTFPDGKSLVFMILGHLFRVPVAGGRAEQLTFGPYFSRCPVVSSDGSRVAFISNSDDSEGNMFVLTLADGKVEQVPREPQALRWSRFCRRGQARTCASRAKM